MANVTNTLGYPQEINVISKVFSALQTTLFLFGLVGNVLTVVVLRTIHLRQSSTAVYLTALAIVDILYLISSLLINVVNSAVLFPRDLRNYSAWTCYMVSYVNYTLTYLSVWLIVAVTTDRAIWVAYPFRARHICTRRNAVITIVLITLVLLTVDAHFFWTLQYRSDDRNTNQFRCTWAAFTIDAVPYMDLLLACVLPFLFMLVANLVIGWQLRKMREFNRRRQVTTNAQLTISSPENLTDVLGVVSNVQSTSIDRNVALHKKSSCKTPKLQRKQHRHELKDSIKVKSHYERSSSLTTMLVSISVFFMVSTSPLLVYDVVYFSWDIRKWFDADKGDNSRLNVVFFVIERTVYTVWYTNFAVHFILYCLNGPPFRARAISLFRTSFCFICVQARRQTRLPDVMVNGVKQSLHDREDGDANKICLGESLHSYEANQHSLKTSGASFAVLEKATPTVEPIH
ncbi:7 transmembrane receptor [Paragonimus heterotremus]|uniref:7 transmembrane receptor n=1 Tax=Paragonimus heterotremus TaxID=100268 RepID=A0A8J4WUS6_9TREM|nr:7 transmembrane receptor [Paragonimus heterotremus]